MGEVIEEMESYNVRIISGNIKIYCENCFVMILNRILVV